MMRAKGGLRLGILNRLGPAALLTAVMLNTACGADDDHRNARQATNHRRAGGTSARGPDRLG